MTGGGGKRAGFLLLCGIGVAGFGALGIWQLERRAWKLDLIARVEARVHAAPAPVPPARDWPALDPRGYEYRRVRVTGRYLEARDTRVDALTQRGAGDWVMTPLRTEAGLILVNRGFVPKGARPIAPPPGAVTVTGLMRASEPGGRFLRPNQPRGDRWFSRDVAAIARARGLAGAAPFFIDAEAAPGPPGTPAGGLTVIAFRNTHLVYALTWFALAALSLWGLVTLLRPAHTRR